MKHKKFLGACSLRDFFERSKHIISKYLNFSTRSLLDLRQRETEKNYLPFMAPMVTLGGCHQWSESH